MPNDSEAKQIRRDRERHRAAERDRIAREREARREELARLRTADSPSEPSAGRADQAAGPTPPGSEPEEASGMSLPQALPEQSDTSVPRAIGGPIRPPELDRFLAVNPADRFDLEVVNGLPFGVLVQRAGGDRELLKELAARAGELMARIKQETDDPHSAGAYLRERVLEWYRRSPNAPDWSREATRRWSGLFADSRVSGGRLHAWVNHRLRAVRDGAQGGGAVATRLRRSLLPDRRSDASVARTAHQQIVAEVAQALLDDLASRPRDPEAPAPLVHLSELAVRRQVPTVNDVLALLFGSPETGPFVILHPNRYPDCQELAIRPPAASSAGAALAYALVPGRPPRRAAGHGTGGEEASAEGTVPAVAGDEAPLDDTDDGTTIWDATEVSPAAWLGVVDRRRRERRRLDPPPRDYRTRAAHEPLRRLLLESTEFRRAFLAVRWRGRPAGLPLLATLLQRGKLAPEVATDHEYLDAELEEVAGEDAEARPAADVWRFAGWTVRREGNHAEGFRYAAEHEATPG